jgi:hypothetical protein
MKLTLLLILILVSPFVALADTATSRMEVPKFTKITSPNYLRVQDSHKHDRDELKAISIPEWRLKSVGFSDVHECSICGCYMLNHFFLCTVGSIGPVCLTWPSWHTCTIFMAD